MKKKSDKKGNRTIVYTLSQRLEKKDLAVVSGASQSTASISGGGGCGDGKCGGQVDYHHDW